MEGDNSTPFPVGGPSTSIVRPTYNEQQFYSGFRPIDTPTTRSVIQKAQEALPNWKDWLLERLPIIRWLPDYRNDWKAKLVGDVSGGVTTGIMMIPQGLAYALLAAVPAVYGLYTNVFPVFMYALLGTSMHISIGVFAVVTILVGDAVVDYWNSNNCNVSSNGLLNMTVNGTSNVLCGISNMSLYGMSNVTINETSPSNETINELPCGTKVDIAVALTLVVGIIQLVMFLLRLGFITIFLSDPLVSGFTTGAAILVGTSQMKHIFGLDIERQSSPGSAPKTWVKILAHLGDTNGATFVISVLCIAFLILMKYINTRYQKKLKFPIPGELIAVILGAGISYGGELHKKFDVIIVENIPSGLPTPSAPKVNLVFDMFTNPKAYIIAIVSYGLTISVCKLFAKKFNYKLGMNQELFAYSVTNIFGSFFSCLTVSGSLTRTVVYANVGGRTLLGSVFSGTIVLVVLLVVAPLFEPLPDAVLGAIVLVALRGLLMQFRDLKTLYYISWWDLGHWLVTFIATVFISVEVGLAAGIAYGMFRILWYNFVPYSCLLGRIPGSDLYRDISRFEAIEAVPGVKIFRFESSLCFANAERFKRSLLSQADLDLSESQQIDTIAEVSLNNGREVQQDKVVLEMPHDSIVDGSVNGPRLRHAASQREWSPQDDVTEDDGIDAATSLSSHLSPSLHIPTHTVIIDGTVFTYMDSVSVNMITQLTSDLEQLGIQLLLAGCRWQVRETLRAGGYLSKVGNEHLFVTVHDAVIFALHGTPLVGHPKNNDDSQSETADPVNLEELSDSQGRHQDSNTSNVDPASYETSV